jgi:hypothetical protein
MVTQVLPQLKKIKKAQQEYNSCIIPPPPPTNYTQPQF